ncbi:hypothetical protein R69619_01234 [Paraburkholderia nemoris]|nr:hypothetical protein [Paraburkholderia aspalathi]CAE6714286.1 hypothetical protein R69619_01234 [Paraburkholderia nemoris]
MSISPLAPLQRDDRRGSRMSRRIAGRVGGRECVGGGIHGCKYRGCACVAAWQSDSGHSVMQKEPAVLLENLKISWKKHLERT